MKRVILLLASLLCFTMSTYSQNLGVGLPHFGSFNSSPNDSVNNQSLNVHVSIPIVTVPGRHISFFFNAIYDSLIWAPVTSGGTTSWTPTVDANGNPTWGWQTLNPTGSLLYTVTSGSGYCYDWDSDAPITSYSNFVYVDTQGTRHYFPNISYTDYDCDGSEFGTTTDYASDHSGLYLGGGVFDPSGMQLYPYLLDRSQNRMLASTSSGVTSWNITDGSTALVVTPGSTSTTYQSAGGATTFATVNYASYSIKTNFGCSGVTEYTGTATLPSSIALQNGTSYTFTYEPTPSHSGYYTGRLQKVTLPNGGYYQYDYGSTNDGMYCSGTSSTTNSLTRTINDGTNSRVWAFGRSVGSGTTTATAPQLSYNSAANQTVFTFDSNGNETNRQMYQGSSSGTLLESIATTWCTSGCTVGTPISSTTTLGTSSTKAETDTVYDIYGNLTQLTEYDWGTGTHGSSSPIRTTVNTYITDSNYIALNLLNLPSNVKIRQGGSSGTIIFQQDRTYDSNMTITPSGAPGHYDCYPNPCYGPAFNDRGYIASITTYKTPASASNGVTTSFTFDWFGNMRTATVGSTQQTQWNYSSTTEYAAPDSVVNGPSGTQLTTSYTYSGGLMATSTDPNSQTTSYAYDSEGRPTSVTRPDSTVITTAYDDTYHKVTVTTPIDSSHSSVRVTASDPLGRLLTTTLEDGSSTVYSIVQYQYDELGRQYKVSNPYTGSPSSYATTQLDALGRPTESILPDGQYTAYSYGTSSAGVTVTDPTGKARKLAVDAAGRTVSVWEDPTGSNYETDYTYDVMDNLTQVSQGSQTRTFTYDALGRVTQTVTPEAETVSFTYDDFNNLLTRTDARGVVTTNTYDGLNRITQTAYNVSGATGVPSTPTVSLTYGTSSSSYNIGRLANMSDGPGSESYTFNKLGLVTQLQKVINSTTYTTSYAYNLGNELTSITYPSGRVVLQNYDSLGRLCATGASSSTCSSGTTYTTGYTYNTAQQVTAFNYGNGVTASLAYSSDRLQMTSLSYAKSGTTLFGLNYYYKYDGTNCTTGTTGNNGQIQCIQDTQQSGRSVAYAYDALARLASATTIGSTAYPKWALTWSYDRYGNRTAQSTVSGVGCSSITCPTNSVSITAATNQISTSGYVYDVNGNMTNDASNTFVYDGENRPTSANSNNASYTYDGNGVRVKKVVSGGTTTTYLFSGSKVIAEYEGASPAAGSPTREYIYSGSQLIAKLESSNTVYYHTDHLSNRLLTDGSGVSAGEQGHFPYGEKWYPTSSTTTKLLFTTYERDSETGNDYAMARSNINRLGRFNSVDPVAGSALDPQTLNGYHYSDNDPVNNVDPSGASDDCATFGSPDGFCASGNSCTWVGCPSEGGCNEGAICSISCPAGYISSGTGCVPSSPSSGGPVDPCLAYNLDCPQGPLPGEPMPGTGDGGGGAGGSDGGPQAPGRTTTVNQCAATTANNHSVAALTHTQNVPIFSSLLSNDFSTASQFIFGPSRAGGAVGVATDISSLAVGPASKAAGALPVSSGFQFLFSSTSVTTLAETAAGKLTIGAVGAIADVSSGESVVQYLYDAGAYLTALVTCSLK